MTRRARDGVADGGVAVRLTEAQALANLLAVLQMCGASKLRCSEKTQRPAAATVTAVAGVLASGDFYPDEPIAATDRVWRANDGAWLPPQG
jgi:hypothetical protein